MLLQDKTAIVSGIGPGMGRDIALAFAREGADVVLVARSADKLDEVASEVRELGRKALCVPLDITEAGAGQQVVDAAVDEFGHFDVLVNNAFRQPPFETMEKATEQDFRDAFEINFFAHAWLTKAAIPHLRKAAPSSIVFINTMSAHRFREHFGIYSASKLALLGMAKTFAIELGRYRIRVNSVHPGYIWGDSVRWYLGEQARQRGTTFHQVYDEVAGETALHHLPGSDEISQAVVFLASEKMSSSITGESIDVNAGMWIR